MFLRGVSAKLWPMLLNNAKGRRSAGLLFYCLTLLHAATHCLNTT